MRSRAMKLLAVVFGSMSAGFPPAAIAETAVQAKDCLAAPDGPATQGDHWYYRTDPATKRRCWYARGEAQEIAQLTFSSARPAVPPSDARLQQTMADARAEISPFPETPQANNSYGSSTATIVNGDSAQSGLQTLRAQSRATAEAALSNVVASIRHRPQPASAKQLGHPAPRSVRMLLSALAGALALVGIATAAIKFGRSIAIRRRKKRGRDRMIWGAPRPGDDEISSAVHSGDDRISSPILPSDDEISSPIHSSDDEISSPVHSSDDAPMNWIRIARETQEARRQAEQIEQLLSQVARRSAI
jgi:hypothetical protein